MGSIKILHHFGFQELVKRVANSCICHARHLQKLHNLSWSGRKITMQERNLQCNNRWLLLQTNEIVWSDCNANFLTFNDVSEEKDWPISKHWCSWVDVASEKVEEEWLREEEKVKRTGKKRVCKFILLWYQERTFPTSPLPHTISFEKYKNILGSSRSQGNNVVHHRKFCRV